MISDLLRALGITGPVAAMLLAGGAFVGWRFASIDRDLTATSQMLAQDHDKLITVTTRLEAVAEELDRLRDGLMPF